MVLEAGREGVWVQIKFIEMFKCTLKHLHTQARWDQQSFWGNNFEGGKTRKFLFTNECRQNVYEFLQKFQL